MPIFDHKEHILLCSATVLLLETLLFWKASCTICISPRIFTLLVVGRRYKILLTGTMSSGKQRKEYITGWVSPTDKKRHCPWYSPGQDERKQRS